MWNQRRPLREDALAISKRELTSDEVRNVLMSLSWMRRIKCGKSQLPRDKATVGLINWGGMSAHWGEERSFIWYMFCFEQQLGRTVELGEGEKCLVQLKLAGSQRNLSDICEKRLQLLGLGVLHGVSSTLGFCESPHWLSPQFLTVLCPPHVRFHKWGLGLIKQNATQQASHSVASPSGLTVPGEGLRFLLKTNCMCLFLCACRIHIFSLTLDSTATSKQAVSH